MVSGQAMYFAMVFVAAYLANVAGRLTVEVVLRKWKSG
jgi:hypothetical protein